MNLVITDRDVKSPNDYVISLFHFGLPEYHPFIATNKWDRIFIDLNENTPRGIIRQLVPVYRVTPLYDKDNITPIVMQLLCEIYPDNAAKIRLLFIKDKQALKELLSRLGA